MKTTIIKIGIVGASLLTVAQFGLCQGFVNLDFESARIIPITGSPNYPYDIATSNAVPGWSVYYGANPQSQITYNDPALGSTFVTLYATNGYQLAGNYSVLLQGGGTASAATISETGLVPVSAESLLFYGAGNSSISSGLVVSMDGQDLSLSVIANELNYTVYGADISSFAGQTETLSFSALEAFGGYNNWNIDNIQFLASPIPEPSTLALVGLGGLLPVWRNRRIFSKA
jgi:PEP-CTERM motif